MIEVENHVHWLSEKYPDIRPEAFHHNLLIHDPFIHHILDQKTILDIVETIIGPNIALFGAHYIAKKPIDLPTIISVELIQISDKTNIPYAPKARKVIEKVKKEEKRVVSEQAPPAAKAKEKPDRIPMPDEKKEKKQIVKKKQNPEEIKPQIRQSSEFEKKEIIDTNQIAALIDKAKEEQALTEKSSSKLTQSSQKNSFASGLTLSQEDALRAQIFGCWSIPLGLPFDDNLLVRIKLKLKKDGTILKSEILDHERMNRPDQKFYKILAESALRAIRICQPLKVPPTGYEKWKDLQLNFDPTEMLKG